MLGDLMTSVQPIEIKIFGDDPQKLHSLSQQVSSIVENVNGTADVFDGIVIAGPSLTVTPDFKKDSPIRDFACQPPIPGTNRAGRKCSRKYL